MVRLKFRNLLKKLIAKQFYPMRKIKSDSDILKKEVFFLERSFNDYIRLTEAFVTAKNKRLDIWKKQKK